MGHCDADMMKTFQNIDLVAVADTNPQQLEDAPEGVETYADIDEMLEHADINTVMVSTPNPSHPEMVKKAANKKKHVICEKPAAMSVALFDEMVSVCKENGVLFTVHQQRRWDKDYRIMKEVYDKKMVGDMYVIKSQLYGFNGNMHDWHIYPEMGGGMLYDWGVHLIDQILDMIKSEIISLYADVQNVINEKVDDYFNIIMKFRNGITAEIELGTYYLTPKRAWFIGGNRGSAIIDGFEGEGKIVRTSHLLENVPGKITMTAAGDVQTMIGSGTETMEQLDVLGKALLPTLAAAVAASGGIVSASARQVATVFFSNLLLTLIRNVLLPLVYFYVASAAAGAMLPGEPLKRIAAGIKKVVTWALTGSLVLFTGYLTLTGAASTSADALVLQMTRSVISTAVPVVGGIISQASGSVLSGAGLLKNSLGVFGMLAVLATCLTPFLHMAVQYLLYKVTAFLAGTAGNGTLVELIDALGSAFGLVLGMVGSCALLLLISITSSVSVVVS